MFRNSDSELKLTSQSSGIWTHGFSTETETADKNVVAQCTYQSATIIITNTSQLLPPLNIASTNTTTDAAAATTAGGQKCVIMR